MPCEQAWVRLFLLSGCGSCLPVLVVRCSIVTAVVLPPLTLSAAGEAGQSGELSAPPKGNKSLPMANAPGRFAELSRASQAVRWEGALPCRWAVAVTEAGMVTQHGGPETPGPADSWRQVPPRPRPSVWPPVEATETRCGPCSGLPLACHAI